MIQPLRRHRRKQLARHLASQTRSRNPLADFPREVQILTIASFFVAVGFGIIVPAIPFFAQTFGVSNAAIGLIVSIFAIVRMSSGLFAGRLVDQFGERIVYAVGLSIVSVSMFATGLASSYTQLLVFRALGGVGSMMFSVAASSVIYHSVEDNRRAQAQSLYNGSFVIGGIAGPALGGLLISLSPRAPFFSYGMLLAISGAVAYFFLRGRYIDNKDADNGHQEVRTIRESLAIAPYRIALIMTFINGFVIIGLRNSNLTLFMSEQVKATPEAIGIGFTISSLASGFLLLRAGRLSDRDGRRKAAIIGALISLIGLVTFVYVTTVPLFYLAMALLGAGGAFVNTVPGSMVGDILTGKGGRVLAFIQMAGDAGAVVGPIAFGLIADRYGFTTSFLAAGAIFLIAVLASFRIQETRNIDFFHDPARP